jgi:hypothetical protein
MSVAILFYIYGYFTDRRNIDGARSRKAQLASNMWAGPSLDCDFEPTKNAFGPGRSINASHVQLEPAHVQDASQ